MHSGSFALHEEKGPYGITVNTLAPGAVALQPRETKPRILKTSAPNAPEFNNFPPGGFLSGRVGYPYDIAYCVLFLADEQSQYITSSTLRADGGAMMH